ncbi:hypothetical protein B0H11DRAFT_2028103 [Mycena galericulata]|nr:hypothetical protein B0H11DRAFT_2028103 [Mycena galericulata]
MWDRSRFDQWDSTAKTQHNWDLRMNFRALPPPADARGERAASLIRRGVLIKGILSKNASPFLDKIQEGALEYARLEHGSLALSFLLGHSADTFVRKHLSDPVSLRAFANTHDATWEWLPLTPLPDAVAAGLATDKARRALMIWWAPRRQHTVDPRQFGAVERIWTMGHRIIVQYYEITDAIRAYTAYKTAGLEQFSVAYFSDWCEVIEWSRYKLNALRLAASKKAQAYEESVGTKYIPTEDITAENESSKESQAMSGDVEETKAGEPPAQDQPEALSEDNTTENQPSTESPGTRNLDSHPAFCNCFMEYRNLRRG